MKKLEMPKYSNRSLWTKNIKNLKFCGVYEIEIHLWKYLLHHFDHFSRF